MENFALILTYLLIGVLLRRVPAFPENTGQALNLYVLYVALPALILGALPGNEISADWLVPMITPWFLLVCVVAAILAVSRWRRWPRDVTGALLVVVPLGNTSYLGIPMVDIFFGDEGMPYAVVYDQVGSVLALAVVAPALAALYSGDSARPRVGEALKKILLFPAFIAFIVALLISDNTLPPLIATLIENLTATLIPVVMVAVGFQLTLRFSRRELEPLLFALATILLAMPLLAAGLWALSGQQGLAVTVSIFEAGMPAMVSGGAVAIMYGLAPRLVSGIIGLSILCGLVTAPVLYSLLV